MVPLTELVILLSAIATLSLIALGNAVSYYTTYALNSGSTKLAMPDGIASGDVTDHTAIIWSRSNAQAQMNVQYDVGPSFSHPKLTEVPVNQTTDFAGQVVYN